MNLLRQQIAEAERPDYILYHRGVLDRAYTDRHLAKLRSRLGRIFSAGAEEWQERYDA